MRALLLCSALLLTPPAMAQTVVDPGALDQLVPPPTSTPTKPAPRPAKPTHARPAPRTTRPTTAPRSAAPKPAPLPKPPVVPPAPPPGPVLPPPIVVPTRPVPPPQPVPVKPEARGEATPMPNGLRLTFDPAGADLNPRTDAALRTLAHAYPPFDTTTFTVTAYAAGTPDDPSTPRRLSLSRALAARALLISEGVTSVRIFVRALGANAPGAGDGPPDRVDITVATAPLPKQ